MPSKKYITIGARVSEKEFSEIELITNRENISVSALVKLLIGAVINGDIQLEKGELKMCVDTHNHAVCDDFYEDEFGKRVDKKFDRLRERGYPEHFIESMKEEILNGIESRIDMLPKKFDARKQKENWGC
jgi:hypothetical protein